MLPKGLPICEGEKPNAFSTANLLAHTVVRRQKWLPVHVFSNTDTILDNRFGALKGLLRGISPRAQINEANWVTALATKLRDQWRHEHGISELPFAPIKGQEAEEYAKLHALNR